MPALLQHRNEAESKFERVGAATQEVPADQRSASLFE